jgi:hypothetical protein
MHTEHDAPNSDVNPESLKLGHEPDTVHIRTILYVPVAIAIAGLMTFAVVTLIVKSLRAPSTGPETKLPAAVYNDVPLNKTLGRIKEPRLDGLEELKPSDQPVWVQSRPPTATGNSPAYHIDDMWPWSKHGFDLGLQSFKWQDKGKDIVRIPVMEAIKILGAGAQDKGADVAAGKLYEKALKSENKIDLEKYHNNRPTASNPQQGSYPAVPTPVEAKGGGQ